MFVLQFTNGATQLLKRRWPPGQRRHSSASQAVRLLPGCSICTRVGGGGRRSDRHAGLWRRGERLPTPHSFDRALQHGGSGDSCLTSLTLPSYQPQAPWRWPRSRTTPCNSSTAWGASCRGRR